MAKCNGGSSLGGNSGSKKLTRVEKQRARDRLNSTPATSPQPTSLVEATQDPEPINMKKHQKQFWRHLGMYGKE